MGAREQHATYLKALKSVSHSLMRKVPQIHQGYMADVQESEFQNSAKPVDSGKSPYTSRFFTSTLAMFLKMWDDVSRG